MKQQLRQCENLIVLLFKLILYFLMYWTFYRLFAIRNWQLLTPSRTAAVITLSYLISGYLFIKIYGGVGEHTKFPTLAQLFPDPKYIDLAELNYYNTYHPEYSCVYLQTYVVDETNEELKPARNMKWEVNADWNFGGNRLTVTYFHEQMASGFREQRIMLIASLMPVISTADSSRQFLMCRYCLIRISGNFIPIPNIPMVVRR